MSPASVAVLTIPRVILQLPAADYEDTLHLRVGHESTLAAKIELLVKVPLLHRSEGRRGSAHLVYLYL